MKERKKKVQTHLTEAQYYKWQFYITEWEKACIKHKLAKSECALRTLQTQVNNKNLLQSAEETEKAHEKQYHDLKKELEGVTNQSLSGKVIDPFTYEIKQLEE